MAQLVITIHVEPEAQGEAAWCAGAVSSISKVNSPHRRRERRARPPALRAKRIVLFLCVMCAAAANLPCSPADAATHVVSLNLCTDQMLVLLAPEKVAALSPLARDPALSFVARQAAHLPVVRASAEAVLRLHPDLILAAPFGAQTTLALLEQEGVPVSRIDLPRDFDGIRQQTRTAGKCSRRIATGRRVACRHGRGPRRTAASGPSGARAGLGAAGTDRGTRHTDGRRAARGRSDQRLGRTADGPRIAAAAQARPACRAGDAGIPLTGHDVAGASRAGRVAPPRDAAGADRCGGPFTSQAAALLAR